MKNLFFLFLSLSLFFGCKNNNVVEAPQTTSGGGLFLKIDPNNRPENVTTVVARLSRQGQETRTAVMNILTDTTAQTSFSGLVVGSWFLQVEARDAQDTIVFYGETNVTVEAGLLTQVNLTLNPVGGGVSTGEIQIIVTWGSGNQANAWKSQSSGTTAALQSVFFLNENLGWCVGESGTIRKTTNGGNTWTSQNIPITERLNWVRFIDANKGWVVGNNGKVYKTTNGGTNWTAVNVSVNSQLFQLEVRGETIWIVGDNGIILQSPNLGSSWLYQYCGNGANFYGMDFYNDLTGIVGGVSGLLYKLKDSASAPVWIFLRQQGSMGWIQSLKYTSQTDIIAVAGLGLIHRSTNGGQNWVRMNSGTTEHLEDVVIASEGLLFAAGDHGTILRSTNNGINWQKEPKITNNWLNSVYFVNANNGWAVGNAGTILRYKK